ncbi:uncharacterized protein FIBRA_04320 [Fibroporia radiculosa]|uniref:Cytochrome P450 monooxygenase pc-3 n=1 Tax=Fibroporia radiculosa TaxID=599839 RepID=J4H2W6_9APHY|nr:uncharacterized protein FIBRA_04320 [Fibroporia radiculosa]CCM02239.1 predicted protein [Fibroporia radiculosa]
MTLPPGIYAILYVLVFLSIPPLGVATAAHLLGRYDVVATPTWLITLLAISSIPLFLVFRVRLRWFKFNRAAARLGAVLPPSWKGERVAGLDVLTEIMETMKMGYPADFAWDKFNELGPTFQINIFWDCGFLSCDPNVIKCILATDFQNFEKGDLFKTYMKSVLGTGVFNSDGDMWKWHRSMTRPFFSKDRISHFELFDRHAESALSAMNARMRIGCAVDFQDLISRFTLDSATEFLFASCVHSLRSPLPFPHNQAPTPFVSSPTSAGQVDRAEAFARAFQQAQQVVAERAAVGKIWRFFEIWKNKSDEHMRIVNEYLDPILEEALQKKEEREKAGEKVSQMEGDTDSADDETLLDHLVKYTSDPVVLHDEVLNILIAGRDTTAASLTFTVYFLCIYPAVLQRLRAEVLEKVGSHRRPTYADIKDMRYLRAVINETLRLYPAVFSIDECLIPNADPNGKPFYIPPKAAFTYSVFAMHRRTEYWGPDADAPAPTPAHEFDPDRFLDERVNKYLTPNPFIFLPFNAGPRICLGQQFAYNEMSFFLIRLLQRFSAMELAPEAAPPGSLPPAEWAGGWGRKSFEKFWPKSHLTLYSNGGLWVKMTQAEEMEDASA